MLFYLQWPGPLCCRQAQPLGIFVITQSWSPGSCSGPSTIPSEIPCPLLISPFPSFLLNLTLHILILHPLHILPAHQHSSFTCLPTQPRTHMDLAVSVILTPSPLPIFWALLERVMNSGMTHPITRLRPSRNLSRSFHLWLPVVRRSTTSQTFPTLLHLTFNTSSEITARKQRAAIHFKSSHLSVINLPL